MPPGQPGQTEHQHAAVQQQQQISKTDQADKNPALSQVDQVVVDHKGQHDKNQVAAAFAPRVDVRQGQREDHQVDGRQGQSEPPGQLAEVAGRGVLEQRPAGHQLGFGKRLAKQAGRAGPDAIRLEITDLEGCFSGVVMLKPLAVVQHQKLAIVPVFDPAGLGGGDRALSFFGGGNEDVAAGLIAGQVTVNEKNPVAVAGLLKHAGRDAVQVAALLVAALHVLGLLVGPGPDKQRHQGDHQQDGPGKTKQRA